MGTFASLIFIDYRWCWVQLTLLIIANFGLGASQTLTGHLTEDPGLTGVNGLSYGLFYSPLQQYVMGAYLTQFRYTQFNLQLWQARAENSYLDVNEDVGPLSEYAAKVNVILLCAQIIMYGITLFVSLRYCRDARVAEEPGDVQPEEDIYAMPREVKEEAKRIDECIARRDDNADELVIVHNLVKRYYSAHPDQIV